MKKLTFTYRDAVALLIIGAFLTLILLDAYLWGGADQYIWHWLKGLFA